MIYNPDSASTTSPFSSRKTTYPPPPPPKGPARWPSRTTSPSGQAKRGTHLRQTTTVCGFHRIRLRQGNYYTSPRTETHLEASTIEVLRESVTWNEGGYNGTSTTSSRNAKHEITPIKASNTKEVEHNPYLPPLGHLPTPPQTGPANRQSSFKLPSPNLLPLLFHHALFIFLKKLLLSSKKSCGGVVAITSRDSLARGKGYQEGRRFESCPRSYLACG
jgi:hypothetical protein